jgi:hypothetical protein
VRLFTAARRPQEEASGQNHGAVKHYRLKELHSTQKKAAPAFADAAHIEQR